MTIIYFQTLNDNVNIFTNLLKKIYIGYIKKLKKIGFVALIKNKYIFLSIKCLYAFINVEIAS